MPPPASKGKVTSPQLNERWQADLMDFKSRTPGHNDGNRAALVVADIDALLAWMRGYTPAQADKVAVAPITSRWSRCGSTCQSSSLAGR